MPQSGKTEVVLKGIAASPGVAHGQVFVYLRKELEIPAFAVPADQLDGEIARFERALLETRRQITSLRREIEERLGEEEAQIFDAHQMVLEDRALIEETISEVFESGKNIESCFQKVASRYIEAFTNIDDPYLKERVADIRDVARRLLHNLLGQADSSMARLAETKIIAAKDLTPSDTAEIEKGSILAITTDQGGRTSHAVIMARSMEVPAVVGLHDITERVVTGDVLLVDGYDGLVIINPSDDTLFRYGKIRIERESIQRLFSQAAQMPAETVDGHRVRVNLNIEGVEDPAELRKTGAEGVGLFRTEGLFLRRDDLPREEEQYEAYRRVVSAFQPLPVTIRTLDLGGDKVRHADFFEYEEANPFMGFRAIRFCLENVPVFKEQLRAILRASAHGRVKLMYPMICSLEELLGANQILEECRRELQTKGQAYDPRMPVGCMIETPSAAYSADHLARHCDFFSIGTNDLIQYMLAVDRINDRIAHLYQPNHPAIMRTLHHIITTARAANLEVSVCGEMAGDAVYAALLAGFGVTELSLTPISLPEVKFLLRHIKLEAAQALAGEVLRCSRPQEISELLRRFYYDHVGQHILQKS